MGVYLTSAEVVLVLRRRKLREAQDNLAHARRTNGDIPYWEGTVLDRLSNLFNAQEAVERERTNGPAVRNARADFIIGSSDVLPPYHLLCP